MMASASLPELSTLSVEAGVDVDGGWFRRVLAPIDSFEMSDHALALAVSISQAPAGPLRFIHVRVWDPPVRGCGSRFCTARSYQT